MSIERTARERPFRRRLRMASLLSVALWAGAISESALQAATSFDGRVPATRVHVEIEPVFAARAPDTDPAIAALMDRTQAQLRYADEWLFTSQHSRHRIHALVDTGNELTLLSTRGDDRYTVIAAGAHQFARLDTAAALAAVSGQHAGSERYSAESIGVEHLRDVDRMLGLQVRKSRLIVNAVASDGLAGFQLKRRIEVTVWHTDALPREAGIALLALTAGPDLQQALNQALAKEPIGFPLRIEARVHDWTGDGKNWDPGSFDWHVSEMERDARVDAREFALQDGLAEVSELPRAGLPAPDSARIGFTSVAPAIPAATKH